MSAKSMSVKSVIQVGIKLCPIKPGHSSLWQVKEGRSIQLAGSHVEPSTFDYVFDEDSDNRKVFDRMGRHIVRACVQGSNGTIFAYGQKSSGKTYIMMGDGQNPGIILLSARCIFDQIAKETGRNFVLRASYFEIYNEKINDLLNKQNQDLQLHEAANGIVAVNAEECVITDEDDLMYVIHQGNRERSAQSHGILCINIESWRTDRSDSLLESILTLVDLAGTERLSGDSPTDSVHINRSLMSLSNVVNSLSDGNENQKCIDFRDCKMAGFLQASLCGHNFTSIICTIKPWILEESQSTLNFAMCASKFGVNKMLENTVWQPVLQNRRSISFPDILTTKAKAIFVDITENSNLSRSEQDITSLASAVGNEQGTDMIHQLSEAIKRMNINFHSGFNGLTACKQAGSLKKPNDEQKEIIPPSQQEKPINDLKELLEKKKNELILKEKLSDEIDAMRIENLQKMIILENENCAKFDLLTLETQESKGHVTDNCKAHMKELQVTLNRIIQKNMEKLKAQHKVELEQATKSLRDDLLQAAEYHKLMEGAYKKQMNEMRADFKKLKTQHQVELEQATQSLRDDLSQALEYQKLMEVAYSREMLDMRAHLEGQIEYAEFEQAAALDEVTLVRTFHEKCVATLNEVIQELKETIKEERSHHLDEIEEATEKEFLLQRELTDFEVKMVELSKKNYKYEDAFKIMAANIAGLEKELQIARAKAASHDDLISKHEALNLSHSIAMGASKTLKWKVDTLQSRLLASEKEVASRDLEIEKINVDLKKAIEANDVVSAKLTEMTSQKVAAQEEKNRMEQKIETKLAALNDFIDDLESKQKFQQRQNQGLSVELQKAYKIVEDQSVELKDVTARFEDINRKFLQMKQDVKYGDHSIEELTKDCNQLRCDLETEAKEKEGLDKQLQVERNASLNLNTFNAELLENLKVSGAELESLRKAITYQKFAYDNTDDIRRQQIRQLKEQLLAEKEENNILKKEQLSLNVKIEELMPECKKNQTAACSEDQDGSKAGQGQSEEHGANKDASA